MFREDKATQMAAQFIVRKGGRIEYLHLLKMMYEADKQAALEYGMPITFDTWIAMRDGPLLSTTYNIITRDDAHDGYWNACIRTQGCDVILTRDPGDDDLSQAEEEVIAAVFQKYGHMDQREAVKVMHALPEWQSEWREPGFQTPVDMDYAMVLRANGASDADIDGFFDNLQTQELMSLLARAA